MSKRKDYFATLAGIIVVGLVIGGLAATLQRIGNPANMGVCVACFTRDIAGALGLHRAGIVQYLRPEIPAFCLGSFLAAMVFREFRPRNGSAPVIRFFLGMFAMIGALIFLGCPWRAMLRLAGGDWNAILGIVGLIVGISIGVGFLRGGFNLGRSYRSRTVAGLAMPAVMLVLLVLAFLYPQFGEEGKAALFRSAKGPGAASAAVVVSTIAGLVIGFLAQRTRFCTVGGIRDVILMRDFHLPQRCGRLSSRCLCYEPSLRPVPCRFHARREGRRGDPATTGCTHDALAQSRRHAACRPLFYTRWRLPRTADISCRGRRWRCCGVRARHAYRCRGGAQLHDGRRAADRTLHSRDRSCPCDDHWLHGPRTIGPREVILCLRKSTPADFPVRNLS